MQFILGWTDKMLYYNVPVGFVAPSSVIILTSIAIIFCNIQYKVFFNIWIQYILVADILNVFIQDHR